MPLELASPESQGVRPELLVHAAQALDDGHYGDINAMLVVRNNKLIFEHYTDTEYFGQDYRHPVKSITKSVTSALFGVLLQQGKMPDLNTPILDYYASYADIDHLDERKRGITVEQVLAMTTGFAWDEFSVGDNTGFKMERSKDWVKFTLDQPMSHDPGEKWVYNSGCSILLSQVIHRASGTDISNFASTYLFEPMGMDVRWSILANDVTNTAFGLALTRRQMAQFGQLYLNKGRWGDQQLVSQQWIEESTRVQTLGVDEYFPYAYGYHWWRLQDAEPTIKALEVNDVYFALGYGGQFIFVIPHLDMVVVSTASNFAADEALFLKLLRDLIFPAVIQG